MTNEEIVLKRMEIKTKSPIHFGIPKYENWWDKDYFFQERMLLERSEDDLKIIDDEYSRVFELIRIANKYSTYHSNGKFQCHAGSNRSAQDIYRLYENYFGNADIFNIMRQLYKIAIIDKKVSTFRCCTVRKQVFFFDTYPLITETWWKADLGVPLREWENIGLNGNES